MDQNHAMMVQMMESDVKWTVELFQKVMIAKLRTVYQFVLLYVGMGSKQSMKNAIVH